MIKNSLKKFRDFVFVRALSTYTGPIEALYDMAVARELRHSLSQSKNPFNSFGRKIFSQNDEDGLTLEIVRRLGIGNGCFAEFGAEGLENNTLVLLASGWSGVWVGGQPLQLHIPENTTRLAYVRDWVLRENIVRLARTGLEKVRRDKVDLISVDLDGNDFYFCEALLSSGFSPSVFIVEYNAKFPPPMKWKIKYDDKHVWDGSDYQGGSLATFNELFERFGYFLVCCNSQTGSNAFFVKREFKSLFPEVPLDIESIYQPPRYFAFRRFAHPTSPKTVEAFLQE
jgi:hypothetical protein